LHPRLPQTLRLRQARPVHPWNLWLRVLQEHQAGHKSFTNSLDLSAHHRRNHIFTTVELPFLDRLGLHRGGLHCQSHRRHRRHRPYRRLLQALRSLDRRMQQVVPGEAVLPILVHLLLLHGRYRRDRHQVENRLSVPTTPGKKFVPTPDRLIFKEIIQARQEYLHHGRREHGQPDINDRT